MSRYKTKGYINGMRYCSGCEKWFTTEKTQCPDCNRRLRFKRADNHSTEKNRVRPMLYGIQR